MIILIDNYDSFAYNLVHYLGELGETVVVHRNDQVSVDQVLDAAPDAIVIAAYGQILKQPLLDLPARGILNVHASLLPKYRGATPAAAAILAGEETTGVTILEVSLALDAGPIVAQRPLPIEPHDTTGTLNEKLAELGANLLIEVLPTWERGEITIASGPTIHCISNPTENNLFTIHIYSPPLGDTVTNYTPIPTYDE